MKFRSYALAGLLLCCGTLAIGQTNSRLLKAGDGVTGQAETDVVAAKEVAARWVEAADAGEHGKNWSESATLFQGGVKKEDWERNGATLQAQLGGVKSRKLKSATYTTTLPGAPEGEYFVVQYNTQYEKKDRATETVIPMRQPDGNWKVAGYFVR